MKKVYTIEILCKDTDNTIYNDNYRKGFATYEMAKTNLNKLIMDEYNDLIETASDNQNYYITDYIDDEKEKCEREIYVETDDYEDLLTRYSIVIIEVEDINTRYDMEEGFAINDELAKKINYMVYKGIKVRYIWDTNTIIFSKIYGDEEDLDTIVYRNYTREDIMEYIDRELKDFVKEYEKLSKEIKEIKEYKGYKYIIYKNGDMYFRCLYQKFIYLNEDIEKMIKKDIDKLEKEYLCGVFLSSPKYFNDLMKKKEMI